MSSGGEVAVAAALSVVGASYAFGADDQASCFDCSSLVQWAWRRAGTDLPRASIDQFQAMGPLAMTQLRPGDLVFYDYHLPHGPRYRGVNHVVMYIGEGRIVEASSRVGAVRVTDLVAKGRPMGARRPGADTTVAATWRYEIRRLFGLAGTPSGAGAWAVARGGHVAALGNARWMGDMANDAWDRRVAAIATGASGRGYWLADAAGRVFAFGDSQFRGDLRSGGARGPIVAIATGASGRGYWLADAAGQVFGFGDAVFAGDMRARRVRAPVVALAATPDGHGYWLADAAGQVFGFGDAVFAGDMGPTGPAEPVAAMVPSPSGCGYWLADTGGTVSAHGDAPPLHRQGDRG